MCLARLSVCTRLKTFENDVSINIVGNERADKLAGMGSRLRFDTMVRSKPRGWFRNMVEKYWSNRI